MVIQPRGGQAFASWNISLITALEPAVVPSLQQGAARHFRGGDERATLRISSASATRILLMALARSRVWRTTEPVPACGPRVEPQQREIDRHAGGFSAGVSSVGAARDKFVDGIRAEIAVCVE